MTFWGSYIIKTVTRASTKAIPTGPNSTGMLSLFPWCLTNCPASGREGHIKCPGENTQNMTLIQLLQLPELLPLLAEIPDPCLQLMGWLTCCAHGAGQQRCCQCLSQRRIPGTSHTPHLPNHFTPGVICKGR